MILVFAELGGERLLAKARELADLSGLRVTAICSSAKKTDKLIALGADAVFTYDAATVNEWGQIFSSMILGDSSIRYALFPSNLIANMISGAAYAKSKQRVGCFLDNALLRENGAERDFSVALVQAVAPSDKVFLLSLQTGSIPEPFEDKSRYGKTVAGTTSLDKKMSLKTPRLSDYHDGSYLDSTSTVTLLAGEEVSNSIALERFASKLRAKIVRMSGRVEVVYGPCIAIEVFSALRDLPDFRGDLISINSREAPISKVASASAIVSNIDKILQDLTNLL